MKIETHQEGDLIKFTVALEAKEIIPALPYEKLLTTLRELILPIKTDFFLFMHTEDVAKYQDHFDKDSFGNYSIHGIRIVYSVYHAEKGKVQPLPLELLDPHRTILPEPMSFRL